VVHITPTRNGNVCSIDTWAVIAVFRRPQISQDLVGLFSFVNREPLCVANSDNFVPSRAVVRSNVGR